MPKRYDYIITSSNEITIQSGILNELITRTGVQHISDYERIGGLMSLIGRDKRLLAMTSGWKDTNLKIAHSQIAALVEQKDMLMMGIDEADMPNLKVPNWKHEIEFSHPCARDMFNLITSLDEVLHDYEKLFFAGAIDQFGFEELKHSSVNVISGVVDRVRKATSPGKRVVNKADNTTAYHPQELANHIKNGYRLEFRDIPQAYKSLIAEYENSTSKFKSAINAPAKKETSKPEVKNNTVKETPIKKDEVATTSEQKVA